MLEAAGVLGVMRVSDLIFRAYGFGRLHGAMMVALVTK